jgi:GNAT superfamily N-acetyltransferase
MVAELDGQLIGMAGVYTPAQPKLAHSGTIWGVFVRPDFRADGVGTKLVRACIDWARAKKYVMLKLSVAEQNHSAERCYKKIGFVTYGIEPLAIQLDGKFYNETHMALKL